jgi:hypothetical protein
MKGRVFFVALVVICSVSLGTATAASAKTLPFNASGHVHCTMNGKVKYAPKLKTAAQPAITAKFKASLTCTTGETGHAGVTVVTGKLKGTSTTYNGSCSSANPPSLTATIKWKINVGTINPTTVTWGPATGSTSPVYAHHFATATVTGSYAGEAALADFVADTVGSSSCGTKGISNWLFTNPANSALDIAPCGPIATSWVGGVGTNGNVWEVVVPSAFPPCATHPTGTMNITVGAPCPAVSKQNATLQDSGINASSAGGPSTSDLWGVDLGAPLAVLIQACGMPTLTVTYSGDSVYQGFSS